MTLPQQGRGRAGPLLLLKLQPGSLRSAGHLAGVLGPLQRALGDPDYNLLVMTPLLDQAHSHTGHSLIDVVPRLTIRARSGPDWRMLGNVQMPERATAELRTRLGQEGSA